MKFHVGRDRSAVIRLFGRSTFDRLLASAGLFDGFADALEWFRQIEWFANRSQSAFDLLAVFQVGGRNAYQIATYRKGWVVRFGVRSIQSKVSARLLLIALRCPFGFEHKRRWSLDVLSNGQCRWSVRVKYEGLNGPLRD